MIYKKYTKIKLLQKHTLVFSNEIESYKLLDKIDYLDKMIILHSDSQFEIENYAISEDKYFLKLNICDFSCSIRKMSIIKIIEYDNTIHIYL